MKRWILIVLFINICGHSLTAQNVEPTGGDGYAPSQFLCISDEQSAEIKMALQAQCNKLGFPIQKNEMRSQIDFILPIKPSAELDDPGYFGISNFVDHDPNFTGSNNNMVTDYQCGDRSYDNGNGYNHRGTDFFTWPFPWQKMDDDLVEVIAAADGVIIDKRDGHDDRSCDFCTNCSWNAVYLQHTDGSIGWYGHLKKSSLTSKLIGASVSQGEYLGIVGSSGNSTGPHLHFEVWEDNTFSQIIDPYQGACNPTTNQSWWVSQEPYKVPGVLKAGVGFSPPAPQGCGNQWDQNFADQYMPGQTIYCSAYFRDQVTGEFANHTIRDQNGAIVENWSQQFNSDFAGSWWWWTRFIPLSADDGEWSYEVNYAGQTETTLFQVGAVTSTENNLDKTIQIYPNPADDVIYISGVESDFETQLIDVYGRVVLAQHLQSDKIATIRTDQCIPGLYVLRIYMSPGESRSQSIVIQ